MNVTLTLTFDSLAEAQSALDKLAADPRQATIDFNDRPDVGGVSAEEKAAVLASPVDAAAAVSPPGFNPFAGSAVAQVPPPPAPSTAAAEALPTAPATSVPPAPALSVPAPPSAPGEAAPAAPVAPASPAGIEVDADGLPWDARIHAGGRAKNADGRWRQRRGLNDAALKARVEAELRQAMGAAASVPVAPIVPAAPLPPTTASPSTPVSSDVPTPPPAAPSAPADESAPQFLARVGGMLASGALTQDRLAAVLATVGLSTMAQLIVAPALISVVRAQIDAT